MASVATSFLLIASLLIHFSNSVPRKSPKDGFEAALSQSISKMADFLDPERDTGQNLLQCYEMIPNCILLNAEPYTKAIGKSATSCFQLCLSLALDATPPCSGFQYDKNKMVCHFFTFGSVTATRWPAYGYDYYELLPKCYISTSPSTAATTTSIDISSTRKTTTTALPVTGVCAGDMKPLMQKAEGFKFQSKDVITIRGLTEAECIQNCVSDQDGTSEQYFCFSGSYDRPTRTCTLSVTAPEPSADGGTLQKQSGSIFFQKTCISNALAKLCPSLMVERVPQMALVGFQKVTITTSDYEMCIERCIGAEQRLGFQCKSLMYYHSTPNQEDNCLLNYEDRKAEPQLFIMEPTQKVDYVEMGMCRPQRDLLAKDDVEPPILIIQEIKTITEPRNDSY